MAKEVGNEPFEGTISSVFANLSLYREAVYAYIASIGVFFLIFSINAYDMVTNHWEVMSYKTVKCKPTHSIWMISKFLPIF